MYIEKKQFQVITLEKAIKIVVLGNDWVKINNDKLSSVKHKIIPVANYAVSIAAVGKSHGADGKYIIGTEVERFDIDNDSNSNFIIPEGEYLKYTFNANTFGDLVSDVFERFKIMREWAEKNRIECNWNGIIVEVYPAGLKTVEFPEMSILRPIIT